MSSRGLGAAIAGILTAACVSHAGAEERWIEVRAMTGWFKSDNALADYQWDVRPQPGWGVEAMAGLGRYGLGLRLMETGTTQTLGSAASVPEASVGSRTLELVGRGDLLSFGAQKVFATASAGRLHLDYEPDHVDIDTGGSSPVRVELAPVNEWMWGGGLGVERTLGHAFVGGLEFSYRAFSLETAHRSGDTIVVGREAFGEWNARLSVGWRQGL